MDGRYPDGVGALAVDSVLPGWVNSVRRGFHDHGLDAHPDRECDQDRAVACVLYRCFHGDFLVIRDRRAGQKKQLRVEKDLGGLSHSAHTKVHLKRGGFLFGVCDGLVLNTSKKGFSMMNRFSQMIFSSFL